jgi:HAD superfamily hydrolase (TIGR01509 family)
MDATHAIIFDMDGVILDSGWVWQRIIGDLFAQYDVSLSDLNQGAFAGGDNSRQWASYLRQVIGLPLSEQEIIDHVVSALVAAYEDDLPLLPGAAEVVARLADHYPLGVASSSPRPVIAFVLERSGLDCHFAAWVSSDDVACGKPAPDVFLEACTRLGKKPEDCVVVEDSRFGIRAAKAAGMKVIAIPQSLLPLDEVALEMADRVLDSINGLSLQVVEQTLLGANPG